MKLTEEAIRPDKIFNQYLALAAKDSIDYFVNADRDNIKCYICDQVLETTWMNKYEFTHKKCLKCHSVLVGSRPSVESFNSCYRDFPSTKSWINTLYQPTESSGKEELWKPKFMLVESKLSAHMMICCQKKSK